MRDTAADQSNSMLGQIGLEAVDLEHCYGGTTATGPDITTCKASDRPARHNMFELTIENMYFDQAFDFEFEL